MINKNFKQLTYAAFRGSNSSFRMKNIDGSVTGINTWLTQSLITNTNYRKFHIGSGTTPPTVEDYCLEDEISNLTLVTSKFTPLNLDSSADYDNNFIYKGTAVYSNNTDTDITVTELALGMSTSGSGQTTDAKIIICREVISPVTIAPGETYTFTITIGG